MAEQENIIQRWVRLKQASKATRATDIIPDSAVSTATPTQAEAAGDVAFDLASLPTIESIAADTDIIAFLRAGVPAELTRAALRRAWASDPAIRDFVGIAENQWDFNDPDAMPGFGPLPPMEDAADALAQISGRLERAIVDLTAPGDTASAPAACRELRTVADARLTAPVEQDSPGEIPDANLEQDENGLADRPGKRRRHGGALPQ